MTNFERITESPEKLAEFLSTDLQPEDCTDCPAYDVSYMAIGHYCFDSMLKWLQEECDE